MTTNTWQSTTRAITSLHLDHKNPRLGRESSGKAPRELMQFLFDHDKAIEVARSIAKHGFFVTEPLLVVREEDRLIVVEGNRRLAALKALREPGLLEGTPHRQVDRLRRQIDDINTLVKVPVVIAPSRRATDRQVAARHAETAVLSWTKENRSSFILDKLQEGYTNGQIRDRLGFTTADIQEARQFRAIADMARSVQLEDEVKAKVENPRAKIFTTIERVFNSKAGREALCIRADEEHGVKINASKARFEKAYAKLVSDIALSKQSSRSLNKDDEIKSYFDTWASEELPKRTTKTIVPADVVGKRTVASNKGGSQVQAAPKARSTSKKVIPPGFKVRHGSERLVDLRKELGKINREDLPNSGALGLRVFLELAMIDYLKRKNLFEPLCKRLKASNKLRGTQPEMRQLASEFKQIAEAQLAVDETRQVNKALSYDRAAPFNVTDLHGFIHSHDMPTGRDIEQFWLRMEPLFRLMLTED
ncbi:MAG: hypothetical protein U5S82_04410 [Gammaproteobacteria bacterium]|nr:hypothetical protein [Gammaproteobacteria bacterium]